MAIKRYILATSSESGDAYIYLLESEKDLIRTSSKIKKFLKNDSNDPGYEYIEDLIEITDDKFIKL